MGMKPELSVASELEASIGSVTTPSPTLTPSAFADLVAAFGETFDRAVARGVPLRSYQRAMFEILDRRHLPVDYFRAVALARLQAQRRAAAIPTGPGASAHRRFTRAANPWSENREQRMQP
jgi:hypothetical protein